MGLRMFLRDWIDFVAKTEFGIVFEYFCGIEVGLRVFLSEEKREEKFGLRNVLSKKAKGSKGVGLEVLCPSKREKESNVEQVRRGVRNPVRSAGKRNMIESVSQIDSKITACCHFVQPIKISLYQAWLAAGAKRKKIAIEFFCKNYLCNSNGFFYSVSFFTLIILCIHSEKFSFN